MGILDNFENAWDIEFQEEPNLPTFESTSMPVTDNMGREVFWEDLGRPENDGLALKIFKEACCDNCACQNNNN
jgi:hypothetical protein